MSNQIHKYPLDRDAVKRLLHTHKVTPTRQRVEIAEFLFEKPQHLSADNVLDGVNRDGHKVSRATIYNTLGLFTRKGLVREVLIDRERVFYDSNNSSHHHIYNETTGELHDIEKTSVELVNTEALAEGMNIIGTDVIIRVTDTPQYSSSMYE